MIRTKFLFLILFSFLISLHALSQKVNVHVFTQHYANKPGNDTIYYEFNYPLTWKDFQGQIPAGAPW
ncbi:MAG TPA: hypothetical protein VFT78_12215, partial [Hanamia sp.]|nr:hypothetical protein [Hanamia sp.]